MVEVRAQRANRNVLAVVSSKAWAIPVRDYIFPVGLLGKEVTGKQPEPYPAVIAPAVPVLAVPVPAVLHLATVEAFQQGHLSVLLLALSLAAL